MIYNIENNFDEFTLKSYKKIKINEIKTGFGVLKFELDYAGTNYSGEMVFILEHITLETKIKNLNKKELKIIMNYIFLEIENITGYENEV